MLCYSSEHQFDDAIRLILHLWNIDSSDAAIYMAQQMVELCECALAEDLIVIL